MAAARRKRVLFVGTGGAERSAMAEGWLRHLGGAVFEVASAGLTPEEDVHPLALAVMAEAGVDISRQRPRLVREAVAALSGGQADYVITVSQEAKDAPLAKVPSGYERGHWLFQDPTDATEDERQAAFRRVRDEIQSRVRLVINAHGPPVGGTPPT